MLYCMTAMSAWFVTVSFAVCECLEVIFISAAEVMWGQMQLYVINSADGWMIFAVTEHLLTGALGTATELRLKLCLYKQYNGE